MERRPVLSSDDVINVIARNYGLRVKQQTTLHSYDDINIHVLVEENVVCKSGSSAAHGFVLKVLNSADSKKTKFIGKKTTLYTCMALETPILLFKILK